MRNLAQYPITAEEIVTYPRALAADVAPRKTGLAGDMRPLLLQEAIRAVEFSHGVRGAAREALDKPLSASEWAPIDTTGTLPTEQPR